MASNTEVKCRDCFWANEDIELKWPSDTIRCECPLPVGVEPKVRILHADIPGACSCFATKPCDIEKQVLADYDRLESLVMDNLANLARQEKPDA